MSESSNPPTYAQAMREAEINYWWLLLVRTGGSVYATAKLAGVNRTYLYKRLQRLQLDPRPFRPPGSTAAIAASRGAVWGRPAPRWEAR